MEPLQEGHSFHPSGRRGGGQSPDPSADAVFSSPSTSVFPSVTHYISEAYDEWDAVQLKNHTSQMAQLALPY